MKKYDEFDLKSYLNNIIDEARSNLKNEVAKNWKYIIGPELYGHIFFISVEKNILNISSEHPMFATAFKYNQQIILKKLKEKCPSYDIRSIKFNKN